MHERDTVAAQRAHLPVLRQVPPACQSTSRQNVETPPCRERSQFVTDLIKEMLQEAFSCQSEHRMMEYINRIMDLCLERAPGEGERNRHLMWFRKLLASHLDGILAHATYRISAGKIEGINNKIKTLRRQAYGYPDDEYFFLKLIDMSRR